MFITSTALGCNYVNSALTAQLCCPPVATKTIGLIKEATASTGDIVTWVPTEGNVFSFGVCMFLPMSTWVRVTFTPQHLT